MGRSRQAHNIPIGAPHVFRERRHRFNIRFNLIVFDIWHLLPSEVDFNDQHRAKTVNINRASQVNIVSIDLGPQ